MAYGYSADVPHTKSRSCKGTSGSWQWTSLSFFVVPSLSLSHKCGPRVGTVLVALKVIFSQGGRTGDFAGSRVYAEQWGTVSWLASRLTGHTVLGAECALLDSGERQKAKKEEQCHCLVIGFFFVPTDSAQCDAALPAQKCGTGELVCMTYTSCFLTLGPALQASGR